MKIILKREHSSIAESCQKWQLVRYGVLTLRPDLACRFDFFGSEGKVGVRETKAISAKMPSIQRSTFNTERSSHEANVCGLDAVAYEKQRGKGEKEKGRLAIPHLCPPAPLPLCQPFLPVTSKLCSPQYSRAGKHRIRHTSGCASYGEVLARPGSCALRKRANLPGINRAAHADPAPTTGGGALFQNTQAPNTQIPNLNDLPVDLGRSCSCWGRTAGRSPIKPPSFLDLLQTELNAPAGSILARNQITRAHILLAVVARRAGPPFLQVRSVECGTRSKKIPKYPNSNHQ